MSNSHQPEDVAFDNEGSLKALVRAIQFSQGQFRLILARCNYAGLRERMVQRLRELSPVQIRELVLPESIKTLYTTIKAEIGDEMPQALMVFGLESVSDIRTVLTSSNYIREEFSKNCAFPLVLWINDEVQQKLLRLVPDLESWATSVEFAIATDELLDLLRQKVKPLYTRDSTIHLEDYSELKAAWKDLQRRERGLEPDLEASLEFVRGLDNFARDRIDAALEHYQKCLTFLQKNAYLERQGILLTYIALAYYRKAELNRAESQQSWEESRHYLQQGIDAFEQAQCPDLVAKHISQLGEVLRRLQAWEQLQVLAEKALALHQGDSRQLAQDYGFLAEVALEQSNWNEAHQLAQQALQTLEKIPNLQPYEQGLYRFLLARSQRHLGQVQEAIRNLEQARQNSEPQYNPEVYIKVLGELRSLYFEQGKYLAAFRIKQEQLQVEHQYGFRAFIGAGYLLPKRYSVNPAREQVELQGTIAQEIAVSSREQDVKRLKERLSSNEHKLIVIHGQSGVGKSSILQAGLIPALHQQAIAERDTLPILLRVYTDWVGALGSCLDEGLSSLSRLPPQPPLLRGEQDSDSPLLVGEGLGERSILQQLRHNADRNLLTVLIFDQFEEFFFVYTDQKKRQPFYDFLRVCLDIPFVKVIFSLREDYLHYLLECDRLLNLTVINNNILDKNIRYYLGNFSPKDATVVVRNLTEKSQFPLESGLVDALVRDLAGDVGEVRPIELQIVGAQLQTEKITTLEQYRQCGTKEKLVERFLEDVIKDCGSENERAARLVLYLLTNENGTRPFKTRAELAADLATEADKLDLVLEVVVSSGLVLLVPEKPENLYQLVHDYLVDFIRQQQDNELLAELQREREQRLLTEEELKRVQAAKQIVTKAKREAEQKIKQGRTRLAVSSGLAVALLVLAGIATGYAGNKLSEANKANEQKDKAEARFTLATANLNEVNRQRDVAQKQLLESQKIAKESELKKTDAEKKFQVALNNQKTAQARFQAAQQETQQANQNLAAAQTDLEKTKQQTAGLAAENQKAKQQIATATEQVRTAQGAADKARQEQEQAQAKAKEAEENLQQAEAIRERAITEAQAAQANLKQTEIVLEEAREGTRLEREGVSALRQFEFTQLDTLVSAMQTGKDLQAIVKDGRPLENYPAISPLLALRTILDDIRERNKIQTQEGIVYSVSFSPDGKLLATAGYDGTARLWNLSGQQVAKFQAQQDIISSVSFSPDGKLLATTAGEGIVRLWNLSGQQVAKFQARQDITTTSSVSFSPDGKLLATAGDDGTARLWNLSGQQVAELKGHQGGVRNVSFSPDGKLLATTGDEGIVRLWNLSGQQVAELKGHLGIVSNVSFSPDGKLLATSGGTVQLWNLSGQQVAKFQEQQDSVYSVSFSPDGKLLATSGITGGTVRLWNLRGQQVAELKGHLGIVRSMSFSPDGKLLATAGDDGTVRLWNLSRQQLAEFEAQRGIGNVAGVNFVSFSSDGKLLATAGYDGTVWLWNLSGQPIAKIQAQQGFVNVRSVSFSPDGKLLATAGDDGTARIWNLSGEPVAQLKGHQGGVRSVSFSPDGKLLATAGEDGTARIWNLSGQQVAQLKGHQGGVRSVSFSPDGKLLATAGEDGTTRVWNLSGQQVAQLKGHQGGVRSVSFSPNGKLLATAGEDGTTRVWNLSGQQVAQLKGHQGGVSNVSFSPDGKLLATAGEDGTTRVWNISGQQVAQLKGHQGGVSNVSFSPDGKLLATTGSDGTVRLLPVEDLDQLLARGCNWLHDYLNNPNAGLSESDKRLCDDIPTSQVGVGAKD